LSTGWSERKSTAAKVPIQKFRLHASNDVERSRRVLRLLYANWLAQVDKPAEQRAPIAIRTPSPIIYAPDPTAPPAARALSPATRALSPATLDRALERTSLARAMLLPNDLAPGGKSWSTSPWERDRPLPRETRRRAVLIAKLAAELYRRNHGRLPASSGALLGPYLKTLPHGINRDDPIPVGLD
jgi:hypothetical protein